MTFIEATRGASSNAPRPFDGLDRGNAIEAVRNHILGQSLFTEPLRQRHSPGWGHSREPFALFPLESIHQRTAHLTEYSVPE